MSICNDTVIVSKVKVKVKDIAIEVSKRIPENIPIYFQFKFRYRGLTWRQLPNHPVHTYTP